MARRDLDRRRLAFPWNSPLVERNKRLRSDEELGRAPCPLCGKHMVARVGKHGPYFHCACKQKENPRVPG